MSQELKKVMVVGGGIAGLTASFELAKAGAVVELVEKSCFLGGHSAGYSCKATEVCRQCGACSVEKMLKQVVEEPNIHVHLATEVTKVERENGFTVSLGKTGLVWEQPLLTGFSKNNAPLFVVTDKAGCETIPEGAALIEDLGTEGEISVDAVVVATGFTPFDPKEKPTYGYGKIANVVSGSDVEQIKRAHGRIVRPTDGKDPEKVAFIQCVGSRDERLGHLWCSRVCCAYGVRSAHTIKFANPEAEVSVFYMDIQNIGKEFPVFYEKVQSELNFVRTIPVDLYPEEGDRVRMRYFDEEGGVPVETIFDLVVLANGIMPGADNAALSELFGVALDDSGFMAGSSMLDTTVSVTPGVFIAGTAEGPRSIPESMAHAGQAAGNVMKYLEVK